MTGTRWALVASALALTTTAAAQSGGTEAQGGAATSARARCADPCQACMQRINGSASASDDACPSNSCTLCDQQQQARAQPGRASGQPATGSEVRTSLDQTGQNISNAVQGATNDLRGLAQMQQRQAGGLRNTLITDAIGTFTGEGLNLEYQRPIAERISGVVGANYSRTTSTTGSLTAFGGEAGLDFFPFSYAGTGLRIGPRLGLDLGQESVDNSRFFTDFGIGGEVGYNWVGQSGLSLQGALGLGGRVGGALTSGLDTRLGGDFGPYAKVNVGWSW
jgi:hypothetical protein